MEFKTILEEVQVYLTEMSVNGLINALSKDKTNVDSVILPKILAGVQSGGYSPGLKDDLGREVDATTAFDQICRSLKEKGVAVAQTGKLVAIVNKLASGNKLRNGQVKLPERGRTVWNPIQRRVPGMSRV